ncbi:MAG: hypothetical protein DRG37_00645 [Deltaproteobacteria bacterium]|nr:MAG: hypothetical protein DRG37_00645 [Deltaproteobacteria bacterium]
MSRKKKRFCAYCGKPLISTQIEGKIREYCPHCDVVFYENPLPVSSSIVVNDNREILLVKRRNELYKGMWCLPMGFAETGEDVRGAALRELEEEAGIEGEVVRLIDVDTVDNYYYGSLAIVTYEVKAVGGILRPGDDAIEAKYFPISDHPPLAWSSNEKAINIYLDFYRDIWAMLDSFEQLFPELTTEEILFDSKKKMNQRSFLSNILVKIIERDFKQISEKWVGDVEKNIPSLKDHLDLLNSINSNILDSIQLWLKGYRKKIDFSPFLDAGSKLSKRGVFLPDVLNAMALSRKAIWIHVLKQNILLSPLEIYTALELNNRIILFYDKVVYALSFGYVK